MHLFRLPARGGLPQRYLAGRWLPAVACTG
jgi:hypothetical protein